MKTTVDPRLREEASRYRLRFGCEDCVHHVPEEARCAEGYPDAPHRGVALATASELEFCKSFELA